MSMLPPASVSIRTTSAKTASLRCSFAQIGELLAPNILHEHAATSIRQHSHHFSQNGLPTLLSVVFGQRSIRMRSTTCLLRLFLLWLQAHVSLGPFLLRPFLFRPFPCQFLYPF